MKRILSKNDYKEMGKRIKNLREKKDMKISEIAEKIDVTYSTYYNIEHGKVGNPEIGFSTDSLIKIARIHEISLDHLIFGEESNPPISLQTIGDCEFLVSQLIEKGYLEFSKDEHCFVLKNRRLINIYMRMLPEGRQMSFTDYKMFRRSYSEKLRRDIEKDSNT